MVSLAALAPVTAVARRALPLGRALPLSRALPLGRALPLIRAQVDRALDVCVPVVAAAVLDRVDLTRLITERVDLDEVAHHMDLDAAAARIDIDAILARVDLIGLAGYIIEGVDLAEIVRESAGPMASEGVRGVRMQTLAADERVNHLIDRMLLRRHGRRTGGPEDRPDGGRQERYHGLTAEPHGT